MGAAIEQGLADGHAAVVQIVSTGEALLSRRLFESMTGLSLTDGSGCLKDELPPITTFLNRLLALTIAMQNVLFTVFEHR